jgi:hypothetical protein
MSASKTAGHLLDLMTVFNRDQMRVGLRKDTVIDIWQVSFGHKAVGFDPNSAAITRQSGAGISTGLDNHLVQTHRQTSRGSDGTINRLEAVRVHQRRFVQNVNLHIPMSQQYECPNAFLNTCSPQQP